MITKGVGKKFTYKPDRKMKNKKEATSDSGLGISLPPTSEETGWNPMDPPPSDEILQDVSDLDPLASHVTTSALI